MAPGGVEVVEEEHCAGNAGPVEGEASGEPEQNRYSYIEVERGQNAEGAAEIEAAEADRAASAVLFEQGAR